LVIYKPTKKPKPKQTKQTKTQKEAARRKKNLGAASFFVDEISKTAA